MISLTYYSFSHRLRPRPTPARPPRTAGYYHEDLLLQLPQIDNQTNASLGLKHLLPLSLTVLFLPPQIETQAYASQAPTT